MPIFSAIEGAAICSAVAPTMTSQRAAPRDRLELRGDRVFYHLAPLLGRRAGVLRWLSRSAHLGSNRRDGHAQVFDPPRKSGGTHRRTSWPSARNCDANATNGWTSPRDPIVDSSTRIGAPLCKGLGYRPAGVS
jgi:hypothetical protein